MRAYLSYPSSGAVYVNPLTEMLIAFEHPDAKREDTNIKIDGAWAVIQGTVQEGFVNSRYSYHNDIMQWGIRKSGGLPPRDIVVSASCTPECATVEQRFFVRGAGIEMSVSAPTGHNSCRTLGGLFSSKGGRAFKDRIAVHKSGKIESGDDVWFVPPSIIHKTMDIAKVKGSWILVSSGNGKVYVAKPSRLNIYDIEARKINISKNYINLQTSRQSSAHLPVNYVPASTETTSGDWFSFTHTGSWKMEFSNHLHIWWNKDKLLAKHSPSPLTGESDDMLWTSKDLKEQIERVQIIDSTHVLVNDGLYIDTYHPEIIRVK